MIVVRIWLEHEVRGKLWMGIEKFGTTAVWYLLQGAVAGLPA
jgi:hypothetical protein